MGRLIRLGILTGVLGLVIFTAWTLARLGLTELNASFLVPSKATVCGNIPGFGPEMMRVPGGNFPMGNDISPGAQPGRTAAHYG